MNLQQIFVAFLCITNEKRKKTKEVYRKQGEELLKQGKKEEAKKMFCKSLTITNEFFYQIIDFLKIKKIKFIIAPYEADA